MPPPPSSAAPPPASPPAPPTPTPLRPQASRPVLPLSEATALDLPGYAAGTHRPESVGAERDESTIYTADSCNMGGGDRFATTSKSLTGRRRAIAVRNCTWLMLNNHIYCTVDPRVDDIPYPYTTIDMHDRDMAPRMLSARGLVSMACETVIHAYIVKRCCVAPCCVLRRHHTQEERGSPSRRDQDWPGSSLSNFCTSPRPRS